MMTLSLEQIRRAADRVAVSHHLEVVEIEYSGGSKHRVLRIFIEKNREERARLTEERQARLRAEAGDDDALSARAGIAAQDQLAWVTHEDCEQFSRDLGTLLDVEDLVPGASYTLEVSSPGLDRKLSTPADFERFAGSPVKIRTFAPIAGNRHWQGKLKSVEAGGIVLDLAAGGEKRSKKKGTVAEETLEIAFANIERANLVPAF
jgi:ribosome maturation factor RimP